MFRQCFAPDSSYVSAVRHEGTKSGYHAAEATLVYSAPDLIGRRMARIVKEESKNP